jgi:hypothetical protein
MSNLLVLTYKYLFFIRISNHIIQAIDYISSMIIWNIVIFLPIKY